MNTRFIADVLYDMKKDYGANVRYITIDSSEINYDSGTRNLGRRHFDVEAIILPQMLVRKFIQDIGYLAADKNFTYGGLNDYNSLTIIIIDLPDDLNVDLDGYIIYNNDRYSKVNSTKLGNAYVFKIIRVIGDLPNNIIPLVTNDELVWQEGLTSELN